MLTFVLAGFGVGVVVGVTGVGGGSLMTPILVLLFGFSPAVAVGTDLLYAAGTKGFGTWLHGRQQTVDWGIVKLLAMGSLPASLVTIGWLHYVGIEPWVEQLMLFVLSAAIIATALLTLFKRKVDAAMIPESGDLDERFFFRWRGPITVAGGVVLGALVTLSSVGAGVLGTTMLLLLYPRHRIIHIVGTDIAHAVPLTLLAGLGHLSLGTTELDVLGFLLMGSLPGIYLGTKFGTALPDGLLRNIVSVLLALIGALMLWDSMSVLL